MRSYGSRRSSCRAFTVIWRRWVAAIPSAAALAAAMVVMVEILCVTAARRIAFSSKNVSWP